MSACADCGRTFGGAAALDQHQRATHGNAHWRRTHAPKAKARRGAPLCPICGGVAAISQGRFGVKAACCGLWSWGLKPLVDGQTHVARIHAHNAFDRLWKGGTLGRGECYRRLSIAMGMTQAQCHIAQMTAQQAARVSELVQSGVLLVDPTPEGREQCRDTSSTPAGG